MSIDLFDDMSAIDVNGGKLPQLGKGLHRVRILRVEVPKPNPNVASTGFKTVVEVRILSTSGTDPVGSDRKFWISSNYRDSFQKEFGRFVFAAAGYESSDSADSTTFLPHLSSVSRAAVSENNALEGRELMIEGSDAKDKEGNVKTNDEGIPYTNYRFSVAEGVSKLAVPLTIGEPAAKATPASPAAKKKPAPKPAPKAPAKLDMSGWEQQDGYALNPATGDWHDLETGAVAT